VKSSRIGGLIYLLCGAAFANGEKLLEVFHALRCKGGVAIVRRREQPAWPRPSAGAAVRATATPDDRSCKQARRQARRANQHVSASPSTASVRSGKEPCLSSEANAAQRPFGCIVGEANPAVIEERVNTSQRLSM
jgi:hypothetical protein